jgi:hypothetical protein
MKDGWPPTNDNDSDDDDNMKSIVYSTDSFQDPSLVVVSSSRLLEREIRGGRIFFFVLDRNECLSVGIISALSLLRAPAVFYRHSIIQDGVESIAQTIIYRAIVANHSFGTNIFTFFVQAACAGPRIYY